MSATKHVVGRVTHTSMQRLLLWIVLCLTLVFGVAMTLLRARSFTDTNVLDVLQADRCTMPCWEGIRPGETTAGEATRILRDHPWVAGMRFHQGMALDSASISWTWHSGYPAYIDGDRQGVMWIQGGIVQSIDLATKISFGAVWLTEQPTVSETISPSVWPRRVFHVAAYPDRGLQLRTTIYCPMNSTAFWRATVNVLYMSATDPDLTAYQLPDWYQRDTCR